MLNNSVVLHISDLKCLVIHTQLVKPFKAFAILWWNWYKDDQCFEPSQAAWQGLVMGLAVLMASAVVELKHETSTLRQRHNFISINFKFGVGDYVRQVANPDKVGSGPMSGRDATWGQHIRVLWVNYSSYRAEQIQIREMCQWTIIMKLGSLFQIPSTKPVWNAP